MLENKKERAMWIEIGLWLGSPIFGAWLGWRFGLAPAPVMAMVTGIAMIAVAVLGVTITSFVHGGIDRRYHDTYYIIASHHSLMQFGLLLIVVALPLALIARAVPHPAFLGPILFVVLHVGAGLILFPQRIMASDLPRRYVEYEGYFTAVNQISWGGAMMSFLACCGIAIACLVALYRMWGARKTV
jgi:cytochrome c oxidase subunit I